MKEKHVLLKDGTINVLGYLVSIVLAFVMTPILIRGLGEGPYGVWTLVESVVAYLALADAGVGAALVRFTAKFRGADDTKSINQVFNTTLAIFALAGAVAAVATVILCIYAPHVFRLPPDLIDDARWLLAAGGLTFGLGLPLSAYRSVLTGLRRYGLINLIQTSMLAVRYSLFYVVVQYDGGLRGIALVLVVSSLLGHLVRAIAVHRSLPSLRFSTQYVTRDTINRIFGYSSYVFLAGAASKLQINTVIIGLYLAPQYITFYAVGALLLRRGSVLIRTALSVLTPAFSMLEGRGDHHTIRELLVTGTKYAILAVVPFQLGLLFLGKSFLQLWVGPQLAEQSFPVLAVLAIPLPFMACNWVANRMLQGIGQVRSYAALSIIQAAVNVVLAVALINWYGIWGVALSTAICQAGYSLAVTAIAFRATDLKLRGHVVSLFAIPLLLTVTLATYWHFAATFVPVESWLGLGVQLAIGLGLYAIALLSVEPSIGSTVAAWVRERSRGKVKPAPANEL